MIMPAKMCKCPDCDYEHAECYVDDHGLDEIYCPMCCVEEDIEDNKRENLNVSYPFDGGLH